MVSLVSISQCLGNFGEILLVKHTETGLVRVDKWIRKSFLKDEADKAQVLNEVNMARQLSHPNIVRLLDFYDHEGSNDRARCFHLIKE